MTAMDFRTGFDSKSSGHMVAQLYPGGVDSGADEITATSDMFVLGGVASTPALENHDLQDLVLGLASDRASVEDSESECSTHLGNRSACIGILNSWGVFGALFGSGSFASGDGSECKLSDLLSGLKIPEAYLYICTMSAVSRSTA